MKFGIFLLLLIATFCIKETRAGDIRFSTLVAGRHIAKFNITVRYKNDKTGGNFIPYISCTNATTDDCPELDYDDNVQLEISFDAPSAADLVRRTLERDGDDKLGAPVQYKVEACFERLYTRRRKWRKAKDVIQDDKRCSKELQSKTDWDSGRNTFTYDLDSNMPAAHFFVTLFVFCQVEGEGKTTDDNQYCLLDTTGSLEDLAPESDIEKRHPNADLEQLYALPTSKPLIYRTVVPDFRTTGLIVGVIVLSICSVGMLIGYFTFERLLKKTN
eukprot:g9111.t1